MDGDEDDDYPPLFAKKTIIKRKNAKKSDSAIKTRKIIEETVIVEHTEINGADSLEFHNFVSANSIFGSIFAGVAVVSSSSSNSSSSSSSSSSNSDRSESVRALANISSENTRVRSAKRSRSQAQAPATSMWWFDAYASQSREFEESLTVVVERGKGGKRGVDDGMQPSGVDRQGLN